MLRRRPRWTRQPPHTEVELVRSDLTEGLVFAALPSGTNYRDLVTGLNSVEADAANPVTPYASAANGGAARPSEWADAPVTAAALTSGQKWGVQATGVDRIVTAGTLLALHSCVPTTNAGYPAFGSHEWVDAGYGVIVGIDKFASEGYGRVILQTGTGVWTSNSDDELTHEPEGKLHFYGAGFDSGKAYFYSSGLGLTRTEESGAPLATDNQYRQTWIGRSAQAGGSWQGLRNYVGLALAWNRVLSLEEYMRLWFNPWQVFGERRERGYFFFQAGGPAFFLYPSSDISTNSWQSSLGGSLFAAIDEPTTPNDSDYIYSPDNPTTQECEVKFQPVTDPQSSVDQRVRFRLAAVGQSTMFTVTLMCGATQIAQWIETVSAGTTTTFTKTLSGAEADSITDYADLRVRYKASAP